MLQNSAPGLRPVDDPRIGFDKFRRRELYAIANAEGIKFTPGVPATSIRTMLNDLGVDPVKYMPQSLPLSGHGQEKINIPKRLMQDAVEEEKPLKMVLEDVNIETLPWKELRAWCKDHGIKINPTDTKLILVDKAKARLNNENPA